MPNFKHGDIFVLPLPNQQYVSGRILLDVEKQCATPKLIEGNSILDFYRGYILVEIYRGVSDRAEHKTSDVLIPGVYVSAQPFKSGKWKIVGQQKVDPRKVEFPENLVLLNSRLHLTRGEVTLPILKNLETIEKLEIRPGAISPPLLSNICCYYLDMKDLLDPKYVEKMNLKHKDLRFTESRSIVYDAVDADKNESYYALSSRLGLDITRFY